MKPGDKLQQQNGRIYILVKEHIKYRDLWWVVPEQTPEIQPMLRFSSWVERCTLVK